MLRRFVLSLALMAGFLSACANEAVVPQPTVGTGGVSSAQAASTTVAANASPAATVDLRVVQTQASILEAGCSVAYEGKAPNITSRIRIAARGSATASVGEGVNIAFEIDRQSVRPDTVAPGLWATLGSGPSSTVDGYPLLRPDGALDTTPWAATFETSVEGVSVASFTAILRITQYHPQLPFFNPLATAQIECKAPSDSPTTTPTAIRPTVTPAPRLTATLDPARDVSGAWRGGINLVAQDQTCQWSGPLAFALQQTGGAVTGTADLTLSKGTPLRQGAVCEPTDKMQLNLNGTVSASAIELAAGAGGAAAFTGSFTTDLMRGTVIWRSSGTEYRGCFQVSRSGALPDCGNPFVTPTPLPPTPTVVPPTPVFTRTPTPTATRTPAPTRTPTPTPEPVTMTIDAASCVVVRTFSQNGYDMAEWQVTASGTASGPVGASLEMPNWLGYKTYTANVTGWTSLGGRFAQRKQGDPASASYSVQFTIQSNASSPPGGYEPLRGSVTSYVGVVGSRNVTCPAA